MKLEDRNVHGTCGRRSDQILELRTNKSRINRSECIRRYVNEKKVCSKTDVLVKGVSAYHFGEMRLCFSITNE